MSFILDALKKSEIERQRQTIPGLVETGAVRPRQRLPRWAIALCALLAVNLIVLMIVLLRSWLSPTAASTAMVNPGAPRAAEDPSRMRAGAQNARGSAAANERPFSPLDTAPVYAPEIAVPPPAPAPQAAAENSPGSGARTVHRRDAVPGHDAVPGRDPVLNDDDYKAKDEEVLPTVNEISLTGAQALPDLHLDVHVYATKPADRFVYVNMRKYHEGATLQEGPSIERIRRDGVILNYQGLRFLLPRQ